MYHKMICNRSLVGFTKAAAVVLSVGACGAPVLAHEGDIGVFNSGGSLATQLVDGEPPSQTFLGPERVFAAELAFSVDDNAVLTDEPHFSCNDPSVLGLPINFTLTKALRVWNDTLGVFEATGTTMTVGNPALGVADVTSPATDTPVAAGTIPVFQTHNPIYLWTLDGATETTGFGVYLIEGVFVNPSSMLAPSEPLWLVFNYGESEDVHDRAVEYTTEVLVPGPSSAVVGAGAALVMLRRRRRAV